MIYTLEKRHEFGGGTLPTPTLEEAERDKLDASTAATLTPTPAPYIPDEAEVEMLARLIWGEARGVPSDMHKAAVVWCVLNRVDTESWPDTVAEVVTQPHQFAGYSPDYPATEEFKAIAADVLIRWEREKREGGEVGRVIPAEYVFFTGDGELKRQKGSKTSDDQKAWLSNLEKQGYFVALCKGWEAAAKVITEYLTMGGEEG